MCFHRASSVNCSQTASMKWKSRQALETDHKEGDFCRETENRQAHLAFFISSVLGLGWSHPSAIRSISPAHQAQSLPPCPLHLSPCSFTPRAKSLGLCSCKGARNPFQDQTPLLPCCQGKASPDVLVIPHFLSEKMPTAKISSPCLPLSLPE